MKPGIAPFLFAALLAGSCSVAFAAASASGGDLAQRLTTLSVADEVPAGDARVAETQKLLDKVVKLTREEPLAVASACQRYVGHLRDAAQIRATPLELLNALAAYGKAGQSMQETLQAYVAARKAAAGRTHEEAMRALAGGR